SSWYCRGWLVCPFLSFFSCYAAPRDLHSFPTRRSSDLAFRLALDGGVPSMPLGALRHAFGDEDLTATATPLGPRFMLYVERPARSEEHTSELQSRENLVCRLLLEKKKIKRVARSEYVRE